MNYSKLIIPEEMIPFFRTNHAGETGAVYIYRGILRLAKDKKLIDFAMHHLETESEHLRIIENILPYDKRSKLIGLWKIAGYLTGLIPAILGKRFVYATIFFVESFVEKHYEDQLKFLGSGNKNLLLKKLINELKEDEVSHKDEALSVVKRFNLFHKIWGKIVELGSNLAVKTSKII